VDIELFKKLGAEKHNNFYNYDKSVYCGKEKIIITCPIHGDFQQNIYSHLYGYICFKCGVEKRTKSQKKGIDKFIQQANIIHNNIYNYSKAIYENAHSKTEIICNYHGSFYQTPHEHLNKQGCPTCGKELSAQSRTKEGDLFAKEANQIHNNFYIYDKVKYVNSKNKIIIICPVHGEFTQTPNAHLQKQGCPTCRINFLTEFNNRPEVLKLNSDKGKEAWALRSTENIKKISAKRQNSYYQKTGYTNPSYNPEIIAKIHQSKKDNGSYGKSIPEDKLYEILCSKFTTEEISRQKVINSRPIDFYISKINLYVQLDGVYYHGLEWPFKKISDFIYFRKIKDEEQSLWFKENNLNLIRVTDKVILKYLDKQEFPKCYWGTSKDAEKLWNNIFIN
jgi:very-short-patch-repair endonuclease